ncbi:hypothetical protein ACFLWR_02470 [Chloroflexota bacterium]
MIKTILSLVFSLLLISILGAGPVSAADLTEEVSYVFTTCEQTGSHGPSQVQVDSAYAGTSLEGVVSVNNGLQQWMVPESGVYSIETFGAKGGYVTGGFGAQIKGNFFLNSGTVLTILAGQMGEGSQWCYSFGGGGGTFVVDGGIPLIIAGGGGAGFKRYNDGDKMGGPGRIEENGGPSGSGGENGNGGYADSVYHYGGGGGGFYTDGKDAKWGGEGGKAFLNGGYGATSLNNGGFGGGGGTSNNGYNIGGGGGGYSGGNGGVFNDYATGGGGSYNSGSMQENTGGANNGHGLVIITRLLEGDVTPPTVTAPDDISVIARYPVAIDIGIATAIDDVGIVSITSDAPSLFPLGTTVVTWSAVDAASNEGIALQNIYVISPIEAIQNLSDVIANLNLSEGIENALISKLENALKSLLKENDGVVINQLNSFINMVEAQGGKNIDTEDVQFLKEQAQDIANAIIDIPNEPPLPGDGA